MTSPAWLVDELIPIVSFQRTNQPKCLYMGSCVFSGFPKARSVLHLSPALPHPQIPFPLLTCHFRRKMPFWRPSSSMDPSPTVAA